MVLEITRMESEKWMLLVRLYVARAEMWPMSVASCFNAFSRVDIRVDVKIPGGVNAYVIDLRGERCVCLLEYCILLDLTKCQS